MEVEGQFFGQLNVGRPQQHVAIIKDDRREHALTPGFGKYFRGEIGILENVQPFVGHARLAHKSLAAPTVRAPVGTVDCCSRLFAHLIRCDPPA